MDTERYVIILKTLNFYAQIREEIKIVRITCGNL
jgi:hypothetical protein